jgi:beta-aspartyl-peptidase (threonine type)
MNLRLATACVVLLMPMSTQAACGGPESGEDEKVVLAIHGGAGTMPKGEMTPERERAYREALEKSLRAGHAALKEGKSSLDAVEAAIVVLEDSPLFNAGKGAVLTHDGRHELDASIMDGRSLRAGAVAGVSVAKNPIRAARAVMTRSPHVMLVGPGADEFVREVGLEAVENSYFSTESRRRELEDALGEEKQNPEARREGSANPYFGTVGAVALDRDGHLAAGTSTGGMTNKRFGRVGDSPIIGAGTYADDESCAVSCTGHGEFFIRYVVAHDVASLVKYKGMSVSEAGDRVVMGKLKEAGGEGGAIILDARGRCSMPFNSEGMYRGTITEDGRIRTAIYRE